MKAKTATPRPPVEIRRNSDGSIDEIVAEGADFHLEQMSDAEFWFCLIVGKREWHFGLASTAGIKAVCTDWEGEGNH